MVVSAPQTEHLTAFVNRSGEMARLACSSISAGTTGSDFSCAFRLMRLQVLFSLCQMSRPETSAVISLDRRAVRPSSSFGNLNHRGNVESRAAAGAFLAAGYTRVFSPQVDFGLNRMGADRAVGESRCVAFGELFHMLHPLPSHRTQNYEQGLCQIRKDS